MSVGLLILSGGGGLIAKAMEATDDPASRQIWQAFLVFWVILCIKMIYNFGWQDSSLSPRQTSTQPVPTGTAVGQAERRKGAAKNRR